MGFGSRSGPADFPDPFRFPEDFDSPSGTDHLLGYPENRGKPLQEFKRIAEVLSQRAVEPRYEAIAQDEEGKS